MEKQQKLWSRLMGAFGWIYWEAFGRLSGHLFWATLRDTFWTAQALPQWRCNCDFGGFRCPLLHVAGNAQFCPDCSICKLAVRRTSCDLQIKTEIKLEL